MLKNLPAMQETRFDPWVGKIPRRRPWQPTSVFLSEEFHGQRSLVGYSPGDHKESDTTEGLTYTHRALELVYKLIKILQYSTRMAVFYLENLKSDSLRN